MKPLKFNITTKIREVITTKGYEGKAFRIQAVFYSSTNPSKHLYLYDAENDIVAVPIPGQMEVKLFELPPVSFKLPLKVLDEEDASTVVVFGELM